jgi:hypothetical protein
MRDSWEERMGEHSESFWRGNVSENGRFLGGENERRTEEAKAPTARPTRDNGEQSGE